MEPLKETPDGHVPLSELSRIGDMAQAIVDRVEDVSTAVRQQSVVQAVDVWDMPDDSAKKLNPKD